MKHFICRAVKCFKGTSWNDKVSSKLKCLSSRTALLNTQVVINIIQPRTNCELYLKLNLCIKICIAEPPTGSHHSPEHWHLPWHWWGWSCRMGIDELFPMGLWMSTLHSNTDLNCTKGARYVRNTGWGCLGLVRKGVGFFSPWHTRVETVLQTSIKAAYCWCHKLCHFSASC